MDRSVVVDGVPIRYRVTGNGRRTIVLVHGHLANSTWWHAIVPHLDSQWQLVLVDLSGHGDSGHRDIYSVGQWADDVVGVLDDIGCTDAVLVAHSLGGSVAVAVAAEHSSRLSGVVLFDTFVAGPLTPRPNIPERPPGRAVPYATREEAKARFRLLPSQPPLSDHVLEPIVENSVKRVDGGWTWKFDRTGRLDFDFDFVADCATRLKVPLLYAYGELSTVVTPTCAKGMAEVFAPSTTYAEVAGGHHHLVLDHAEQCAALIDEFARSI